MGKKRYKRRMNNITVTSRDNPVEYARQYYWVAVKGKNRAPRKRRKGKQRR